MTPIFWQNCLIHPDRRWEEGCKWRLNLQAYEEHHDPDPELILRSSDLRIHSSYITFTFSIFTCGKFIENFNLHIFAKNCISTFFTLKKKWTLVKKSQLGLQSLCFDILWLHGYMLVACTLPFLINSWTGRTKYVMMISHCFLSLIDWDEECIVICS